MIYFDNAATTFPKPTSVIDALDGCVKEYCGNSGRSAHMLAIKTSEKIYDAREKISKLLNYDYPENVVFTMNASYALNMGIKTSVKFGEHVLISDMEHNSVLRPVENLRKQGLIEYTVFSTDGDLEKEISSKIQKNTGCIISNAVSNVTGNEISLYSLSKIKQKYNIKLILDVSQLIGHKKIDLKTTPCDVLCAPSHKALFGIQGGGFCIFCDGEKRQSFIEGGSGNESLNTEMPKELPERFEAGTLPAPAIISLGAGIDFIEEIGLQNIENKLSGLMNKCIDILDSFKSITIYGGANGVVSFRIKNIPPYLIANEMNNYGICIRSGLHCAPLMHKKIHTEDFGTARISFSYLNVEKELDMFYHALYHIINKY